MYDSSFDKLKTQPRSLNTSLCLNEVEFVSGEGLVMQGLVGAWCIAIDISLHVISFLWAESLHVLLGCNLIDMYSICTLSSDLIQKSLNSIDCQA